MENREETLFTAPLPGFFVLFFISALFYFPWVCPTSCPPQPPWQPWQPPGHAPQPFPAFRSRIMERMARHTAAITISNIIMVDKFSIRNVISAHILSQKLVLSNPRIQLNTSCTFCQEEEPRFFPICPISSHLNFFSKYATLCNS